MPRQPKEPAVKPVVTMGLECRHCGCTHFFTRNKRERPYGVVRRLKECRNCGARVHTIERMKETGP